MIHHIAGITAAAPQTSRLPLEPLSLWRRRNWRWLVCVTSAGTGRWWQRRRLCKVAEDRPNADRQASETVTCHPELANNLITQPLIHSGFSCKSFAVLWDVSEPGAGDRGQALCDPRASLLGWPELGRGGRRLSCSCTSKTRAREGDAPSVLRYSCRWRRVAAGGAGARTAVPSKPYT